MQPINMQEINYDRIEDINIKLLPCEIEMLIRGMETYMFIFHNIYTQHDDSDEMWTRDFVALNLYNKLKSSYNHNFRTNYDVHLNCKNHANAVKRIAFEKAKKYYKKIA